MRIWKSIDGELKSIQLKPYCDCDEGQANKNPCRAISVMFETQVSKSKEKCIFCGQTVYWAQEPPTTCTIVDDTAMSGVPDVD